MEKSNKNKRRKEKIKKSEIKQKNPKQHECACRLVIEKKQKMLAKKDV